MSVALTEVVSVYTVEHQPEPLWVIQLNTSETLPWWVIKVRGKPSYLRRCSRARALLTEWDQLNQGAQSATTIQARLSGRCRFMPRFFIVPRKKTNLTLSIPLGILISLVKGLEHSEWETLPSLLSMHYTGLNLARTRLGNTRPAITFPKWS